jgi:hypothetical protein
MMQDIADQLAKVFRLCDDNALTPSRTIGLGYRHPDVGVKLMYPFASSGFYRSIHEKKEYLAAP